MSRSYFIYIDENIFHAGVENKELYQEEYEGCQFKVTTGDYNDLLKNVVDNLELAMKHAAKNNEKMNQWKQAHSQAVFIIMLVMLEAGDDFLTVKEVTGEDGQLDLLISMDREKINTVGQEVIAKLVLKHQVYKNTGDLAAAEEM